MITTGSINADLITTGTLNAARIKAGILQDKNGGAYFNLNTGTIGCDLSNGLKMRLSVAGLRLLDGNENELVTIYGTVGSTNYGQVISDYGEFKTLRIHSSDNARVSRVNIASDNSLFAVDGISSDGIYVKADNSSNSIGSFTKNAQSKSVLTTDIANITTANVTNITVNGSTNTGTLGWWSITDSLGNTFYLLGYR